MLGVVIGTGPSLDVDAVKKVEAITFGPNNVFLDLPLTHWLACDPAWHGKFGPCPWRTMGGYEPLNKWHWNEDICRAGGYQYIEGRWFDGVSPPGSDWISFNHGSGPQLLNLAVLHCDVILLVGHDMKYEAGKPRHYFSGLSDVDGEYPQELRKHSEFAKPKRDFYAAGRNPQRGPAHPDGDGILYNYKWIAEQAERGDIPPVYNCTPDSAMKWFPMRDLQEFQTR